ncbi:M16 family metallopeptidase [Desulfatibacillum aliphaticivorans]|uniref:M16 family metallopeptidase n=1 Tax=Desulfatibacillum aliphaticivorans TaxID=218208 RepID=UPI001470E622|nr:M16 family metallopeptidase [Desulfatibacillum aliphaticivorans]
MMSLLRKNSRYYLAAAVVMIFALLLPSALWAAKAQQPVWPHEKSDLPPDPSLAFGRLPNGFGYVLMHNEEPKNRVSIKLGVKAGSLNEEENQRGLAHYLEHMAFNGSEHFPPGELVQYFQAIGMRFGNDVNAHTGFNETVYQLLLPDGTKESLEKGLTVMADYSYGLSLLPEEIDRERGIILAEKQTRDSVASRTFEESLKFFMDHAKISYRMPIGTEEVIKAADQTLLKEFYDAWYRPDNIFLVMVGDFDPQTAVPLIEKAFGPFKARTEAPQEEELEKVVHKGTKTFYHHESEAGNTSVSIETISTVKPKPDSFAVQKKRVLEAMANRIVKYRLDYLKEQPDAPFTDASIGSGLFLNRYNYSSISADCSPENWEGSLAAMEQELRQALRYGFTQEEVDRVQKEFLANLDTAVAAAGTRNSDSLARLVVRNVMSDEVMMSPAQEKELFGPVVSEASRRALHKALRKAWPSSHRLVLVTGNAAIDPKGATPEEYIETVFEASAGTPVHQPEKRETKAFPYLPEPQKPGKVVQEETIDDLGVVRLVFENGVSVNIKKTDFKDSQILASMRLGSGRAQEPVDKPGLAYLAPSVFNKSGLGGLTHDELKRALAGASTSVGLKAKEEAFFMDGATIPKELPLFFRLYSHYLRDPAFRQDAYDRSMKQFEQMYDDLSHTVEGALQLHVMPFFAGMDSRFGMPPRDQFMALTLEDAENWTAPALRSAPIELSIVGDLDVDEVKSLAALYLGSLPERTPLKEIRDDKVSFPAGESRLFNVDTKIVKGMVLVAFPTEDVWDISRTRRLSIMAEVFSDRLRKDVREKLGLTYSPQAWNHPRRAFPGYGYLAASITIDPSKTDEVVDVVKKIAEDLAAKGPDKDEVERALAPSVTSIKDMLRTNPYWLNTVLSGSSIHPQQLEWCRSILQDYSSITTQDVAGYAKKYLINEKAAVAVIVPQEIN